jgi:dynein heavy chain
MPIVTSLRNTNLTETHWEEIRTAVGPGLEINNEDFSLQTLLEMNVVQYQEDIVGVSARATGEWKLRTSLTELIDLWKTVNFTVKPHKDKQDSFVLSDMDTIFTFLDEGQATINMILGNRFVKVMRKEAEDFRKSLLNLSTAVDEWILLQQQWIYLENVFQAPDIKKYLGPAA